MEITGCAEFFLRRATVASFGLVQINLRLCVLVPDALFVRSTEAMESGAIQPDRYQRERGPWPAFSEASAESYCGTFHTASIAQLAFRVSLIATSVSPIIDY